MTHLAFILTFWTYLSAVWQLNPGVIAFSQDPIRTPKPAFSIAAVDDQRPVSASLGTLLTGPQQTVAARFPESLERTLSQVLKPGFRADSARVPVVVQVRTFAYSEQLRPDGRIDGSFKISLAFKTFRDQKLVPLTSYTNETKYVRSVSQTAPLGGVARRAVENAMNYLADWLPANREATALVKGVRFVFKDYTQNLKDSDTVFYSPKRPLTWADFGGKPRPGKNGAAVFASFSYEGKPRWINGYLQVELTFKTYVQKSMSWVNPSLAAADHNGYYLLHEQRHFDLVKLVVERFKQRILVDDDMDAEDYSSRLQFLYLDAFRDMNRRQEQYDAETQHGLLPGEQDRWNRKIMDELHRAEEQTQGLLSSKWVQR
ncbi:hypothetical protein [Tellurirhabdus rosea]|uniref:hypothetical protein n=1 Tax=Tellurirhabdus rosea TaxID=2674997 RepID=UPI0022539838|nr:hypothetical protein [Tellurirhabdus rosea]